MVKKFFYASVAILLLLNLFTKDSLAECGTNVPGIACTQTNNAYLRICEAACGGEDNVIGCSQNLGYREGFCVCDDGKCDVRNGDCPVIAPVATCYNYSTNKDIDPFVYCGMLGSQSQCCSTQSQCDALIPPGECNPLLPLNGSDCIPTHCDPADYPANFQPRCVVDTDTNTSMCVCTSNDFLGTVIVNRMFCNEDGEAIPAIVDGSGNPNRLYTAFGCFYIHEVNLTTAFFLTWGLGVGGGLAFVMLIYVSIQVILSAGNPQKVKSARELLWSVLGGILLLILSVIILRIVGVEILRLPSL